MECLQHRNLKHFTFTGNTVVDTLTDMYDLDILWGEDDRCNLYF